jgi:guanylate kinase
MRSEIIDLRFLHTITTRKRRSDDTDEEIRIFKKGEFMEDFATRKFLYANFKEDSMYGYSKAELTCGLSQGLCLMMVFHGRGALALKREIENLPTIFLSSPANAMLQRCRQRPDWTDNDSKMVLDSLTRSEEIYRTFGTREKNCIRLENTTLEQPIQKEVVSKAVDFWRKVIG